MQICFQLACQTYTDAWTNPRLFYPLSALPELLATIILSWECIASFSAHFGLCHSTKPNLLSTERTQTTNHTSSDHGFGHSSPSNSGQAYQHGHHFFANGTVAPSPYEQQPGHLPQQQHLPGAFWNSPVGHSQQHGDMLHPVTQEGPVQTAHAVLPPTFTSEPSGRHSSQSQHQPQQAVLHHLSIPQHAQHRPQQQSVHYSQPEATAPPLPVQQQQRYQEDQRPRVPRSVQVRQPRVPYHLQVQTQQHLPYHQQAFPALLQAQQQQQQWPQRQ